MKRTPLTRKTPLARGSRLQRGGPLTARRVSKRFAKRRRPGYAAWIRGMECLLARRGAFWESLFACDGPTECAHVKSRGAGGEDFANTVPLCRRHHRMQHMVGIKTFCADLGLDLAGTARALAVRYEDEA